MKIKDYSWTFKRVWSSVAKQKTADGFSYSDDGERLIIRNDYFEIAEAHTELALEPNSEYQFSIEARVVNFELNPKSEVKNPDYAGGAVPEYQSANGVDLVMYTPKLHNSSEWTTLTWKVKTNDTKTYALRLRNGTASGNDCKGTAYFRNLKWDRIGEIKHDISQQSANFQKLNNYSLKAEADALIASGKEYFNSAMASMRNSDFSTAIKQRDLAAVDYKKAISIINDVYGQDSMTAANVYSSLGGCYKWISSAPTQEELNENVTKALTYLMSAAKIWEEKADAKKYNQAISALYVDIGGLYYMQGNYKESLSWRLKAYKALIAGEYSIENLGQVEFSLRGAYEKTNSPKQFAQFLSDNQISPVIESATAKEINARLTQWTVKLRGIEKPYVWDMG